MIWILSSRPLLYVDGEVWADDLAESAAHTSLRMLGEGWMITPPVEGVAEVQDIPRADVDAEAAALTTIPENLHFEAPAQLQHLQIP